MDAKGKVTRINLNNSTRDSVLDLPLEDVQPFYRALRAFEDMMNRRENLVTFRMEPGQWPSFYTFTQSDYDMAAVMFREGRKKDS